MLKIFSHYATFITMHAPYKDKLIREMIAEECQKVTQCDITGYRPDWPKK
jgi:hypothetical protein